jgi:hypothetical protein
MVKLLSLASWIDCSTLGDDVGMQFLIKIKLHVEHWLFYKDIKAGKVMNYALAILLVCHSHTTVMYRFWNRSVSHTLY